MELPGSSECWSIHWRASQTSVALQYALKPQKTKKPNTSSHLLVMGNVCILLTFGHKNMENFRLNKISHQRATAHISQAKCAWKYLLPLQREKQRSEEESFRIFSCSCCLKYMYTLSPYTVKLRKPRTPEKCRDVNVDCVLANHNKVKDTQANLKTADRNGN